MFLKYMFDFLMIHIVQKVLNFLKMIHIINIDAVM